MTDKPADRFRIGDVWQSPDGKTWIVERLDCLKGALLARTVNGRRTTQWRNQFATGRDMLHGWTRVSSGDVLVSDRAERGDD